MARPTLVLAALAFVASQAPAPDPVRPDPDAPRPIPARDTVFMEDMTWMEVRDAMKAGKDTAIVATGGIEQNGPYLVAGKHNVVLRATTEAIARKLGDALVAPIVPFVPEGDIDPPTEHMRYPSHDQRHRGHLPGPADRHLRLPAHARLPPDRPDRRQRREPGGHEGGGRRPEREVVRRQDPGLLSSRSTTTIPSVAKWLETQGIKQTPEGLHDDFAITAQMAAVDPNSVRAEERIAAGKFRINGVDLAPVEKTAAWGRKIADYRAEATIAALRRAMGAAR